ncbi:type II toxin-antitoxin system RelE/ParE family toxin [Actinomadura alba]|uniref:Type II toxin-antitoxin system RelE/ParE family toxin n=1 Tax=Actinomadura alba TaxID=406431 RepID=A0ABR7LJ85_9ACTN|nr:type II toxin-antitoxin system RelE/ParE family toxin [Actinomadura alba]
MSARAKRDLAQGLPEKAAIAAWVFINGALLDNPRRVGKPLRPPLEPAWSARRGEYRVIYLIDDGRVIVEIVNVQHRRDAYRA